MSVVKSEQRTEDGVAIRARIDQFLTERGLSGARVLPLTGDASDRRYFRVNLGDDGTQVLAVHPGPIDFASMPFIKIAKLLSLLPVPVPAILSFSNALGIISLEDLGDVTLQAHIGAGSPAEHKALYRQAIGLIETLQRRGATMASPEYPPYAIAFDVEKLTWELDFFLKNFLEGYRSAELSASVRDALRAGNWRVQTEWGDDLRFHPAVATYASAFYLREVADGLGVDPKNQQNFGVIFAGYNVGPGNADRLRAAVELIGGRALADITVRS